MKRKIGKYIVKKVTGESYRAYVPDRLPPRPALDMSFLSRKLEQASFSISELNSISRSVPNPDLFLYMYVRKEALLSSQIEGTQSSLSDLILFENSQKPKVALDDVEEVSNYVKAIKYGLSRIKNGFPLSLRLLKEIHKVLLSGSRGSNKLPGEFRCSQNWIGGTRPGNALFVPPPVDELSGCLSGLEDFFHNDSLPLLIKAGLCHVQFEIIHPFLDGNGRLGRLLIIFLMIEGGALDQPILYLSLYLKKNRKTYYDLLQEVREHGTWETWLEFFLDGVISSSSQAIKTTKDINNLFIDDLSKIATLGKARFSCEKIFEYIKKLPQVSVSVLIQDLNISAPTARKSMQYMENLGILEEISGKKRDSIYVYRKYLELLEYGTEAL